MNLTPIIVFDFETNSIKDPWPLEIGAVCYDARSLEIIKDATFTSLCRPPDNVVIEDEALEINHITRKQISDAPCIEVVWKQFVSWVNKYNKKKNKWEAPIPAGMNIRNFDLPIVKKMNILYGDKKEDTILFNTFKSLDLLDFLFIWFENSNELNNFKLAQTVCPYFGIKSDGAHRALFDVQVTGDIMMRFLKYHRKLMEQNPKKFKGAFAK